MPNCIQLINKKTGKPTAFQDIDTELCNELGLEWDENHYTHGWYDNIGMLLSIGRSFEQLREVFKGIGKLPEIIDYLDKHYTTDSWYQVK